MYVRLGTAQLSAILGSARGCTVRAAKLSGVIQIYRSDLAIVLQKRFAAIIAAAEYESNRESIEAEQRKRLQEREHAKHVSMAERASKRTQRDFALQRQVEQEICGQPFNELARDREWATGANARALRKEFEIRVKDLYARFVQRAMRRYLKAKRQAEQFLRDQYIQASRLIIQRIFRGHLARRQISHMRHMRMMEPIDFDLVRQRRLKDRDVFRRREEVRNKASIPLFFSCARALSSARSLSVLCIQLLLDAFLNVEVLNSMRGVKVSDKLKFFQEQRQTKVILEADEACKAQIFDALAESVRDQRLTQLKALLKGIKVGTVFGFSFLTVSESIRIPIKVGGMRR